MKRNAQDYVQAIDSKLILGDRSEPVFLTTSNPRQRCHQRWWTALPAVPAERESNAYRRLWRHFADHTMNTFKMSNGSTTPGARGFYVEGREDHLVPAFFENFTMFPQLGWLELLLLRLGISADAGIQKAAWSYSYSEPIPGKGRLHADIIVMWHDDSGPAVLVIEAKKPGCGRAGIGLKDLPTNGHYLHYQAMRRIGRRHQALLVDERDLRHLPDGMATSPAVITWQDLVAIQRGAAERLEISSDIRDVVLSRMDAHYAALGVTSSNLDPPTARADGERYAELSALDCPDPVKEWLIGSELYFAARGPNATVQPPYGWLLTEMTMTDYSRGKLQSTSERERPIWLI